MAEIFSLTSEIIICGNTVVSSRWDEIADIIWRSFDKENLNDGYTVGDILREICSDVSGFNNSKIKHILALDSEGSFAGGVFSVFNSVDEISKSTDVGWVVVDTSLPLIKRTKLIFKLILATHDLVAQSGYTKIVTEIGTKAGIRLLKDKFGYTEVAQSNGKKWWIKCLV